jgi:endo-1,4-beta-xylanase
MNGHKNFRCLDRRSLIAALVASAISGCDSKSAPLFASTVPSTERLKTLAAAKGMYFGSAVTSLALKSDPLYSAAIIRDCSALVPEYEMKWRTTESRRGQTDYTGANALLAFAKANSMRVRGHTLAWYKKNPDWLETTLRSPADLQILYDHIFDEAKYFKGRVQEWDVVNEVLFTADHLQGGFRDTPFWRLGGMDYIGECFNYAHRADPNAILYYNDNSLEYDTPAHAMRRKNLLSMLKELISKNIPIKGLGIQSHLKARMNFNPKVFGTFLKTIADLGLCVTLTELDVDDEGLPSDYTLRANAVAQHCYEYLTVAFSQPAVKGLLTWELSNRFTWLDNQNPRKDKQPHFALPLSQNMEKTPLWFAIAQALEEAPAR